MKRGYLGIFEGAYLAGQSEAYRLILNEWGIPAANSGIPLEKMVYVAAFQADIERFVTSINAASGQPIDRFISARVSKPKKINAQVLQTLISLRPTIPEKEAKQSTVWMALYFVYDLIVAMENNAAIINISGIPKLEDVRQHFAPEVAIPICTILSALKSHDEILPAPSQIVSREVVRRFRELLNSDVYNQYSAAHQRVETEATESVLSEIRTRGAELLSMSKGVLANRRVSMNIISFVPKIVDAAFGKLPGALAQFAGDLAAKFVDDRKNVIVYQFDAWAREHITAAVTHVARDRTKAPMS
jgi:hypothetical protein